MRSPIRRALLAATALATLVPFAAEAQAFPDHPIRLLIPYAAGGPTSIGNGRLRCGHHNRLRNTRADRDDEPPA